MLNRHKDYIFKDTNRLKKLDTKKKTSLKKSLLKIHPLITKTSKMKF